MKRGSVISLKNVWKTYHMGDTDLHAVREVNLDVKQGEFVVIVGPSGSGKSTMIDMIGCLDVPTKGNIYLDGKDVSHMSESDLARIRGKKIGFIFQQFNLISTLTAAENVYLPMSFQNIPRSQGLNKAIELLKKVNLGQRYTHKPNELSGGERQRVAIARSLANDPQVILADEPTGNLDSKTGKEVMNMLSTIHKGGSTVVLITHDLNLIQHAERTIYLKDGMIEKIEKNNKKGDKREKSKK
jgi:putative ABC transport system ATP-binding protein